MIEESHEKFQSGDPMFTDIRTKHPPPSPRIQVCTITARPSTSLITYYGIYSQRIRVGYLAGARDMFPAPRKPASCPMSVRGSFLCGKAVEAWSWSSPSADVDVCTPYTMERGYVVIRKYFHAIFICWWKAETGFLFHNVWRIVHRVDGLYLHPPIRLYNVMPNCSSTGAGIFKLELKS
jgi:hypothetical protein